MTKSIYEQNMAKLLEGDYIDVFQFDRASNNICDVVVATTLQAHNGDRVNIYYSKTETGARLISDACCATNEIYLLGLEGNEKMSKEISRVCETFGLLYYGADEEIVVEIKSQNGNNEQKRLLHGMVEIFKLLEDRQALDDSTVSKTETVQN